MSDMTRRLHALGATAVNVGDRIQNAAPPPTSGPIATTPAEDVRQRRAAGF